MRARDSVTSSIAGLLLGITATSCGSRSILESGCTTGQTLCENACIDLLTSPQNCGACGNACSAVEVCSAGSCATSCPGGTTQCGQSCVDSQFDPHHCGNCSTVCALGLVCSNGQCGSSCASQQTLCNDGQGIFCASLQTDNANCGTCGNACILGASCVNGACAFNCPSGEIKCGTLCIDPQTDQANCGACGAPCWDGSCTLGRCYSQLAVDNAYELALGKNAIYWTNRGAKWVGTASEVNMGNGFTTYAQPSPLGIAADPAGTVYWTNELASTGTVTRLNSSVSTFASSQNSPDYVTACSSAVCWTLGYTDIACAPSAGGAPTRIASSQNPVTGIAADANNVYWLSLGLGTLMQAPNTPADGGAPVQLAGSQTLLYGSKVAVDGKNVYWSNDKGVYSVPIGGGNIVQLASAFQVSALATDGVNVYFANGSLQKVPVGGGTPTVLGSSGAGAIVLDSMSVYYSVEGSSSSLRGVFKITPK